MAFLKDLVLKVQSMNNAKESKEASRRVELRLQFYGLKDKADKPVLDDVTVTQTLSEKSQLVM